MPKGHCENFFRFKVNRLIENDSCKGNEEIETLYFKEQKDLTTKLGIPKSTVYIMIRYGDEHKIKKWKNYFISKCREPAFQSIPIEYY